MPRARPHNSGDLDLLLGLRKTQWALVWLGLLNFTMCIIHVEQVLSDKRFVHSPDSIDPHPSRTLRVARFLDIAVSFLLGSFLITTAIKLHWKKLRPIEGRVQLKTCMLTVAITYFFGAAADFVQCHYQAGGIGPQCHGYSCLSISGSFLVAIAVMLVYGRIFVAFCLFSQSAYRIHWLIKQVHLEDPLERWSLMVMTWVVVLGVYPLILLFSEVKGCFVVITAMLTLALLRLDDHSVPCRKTA
jgi:hypothetical protein